MDTNTTHTFEVLLSRREYVEASLQQLNKRCARKGLPLISWDWGKAYKEAPQHVERDFPCQRPGTCSGCVTVSRIPLTLTGATPKYAGWTFLAALTHVEDETVIRSFSGDVPAMYRTRGPACDHCKAARRRGETYVVRHDDGRTMQVGSTCIADFLGSNDAIKLAAAAEILATACDLAGDEGGGFGGGGSSDVALVEDYLPMVAWCVREIGWCSRTAARESITPKTATADQAMTFLFSSQARKLAKVEIAQEDNDLAAAAAKWAEELTDAQVEGDDYKHNLRVVARAGYVKGKLAGIAASMIVAYQRHLGIERKKAERAARPPSEYVGTVGNPATFSGVLDFVTGYETDYGYTTVLKFITDAGAVIVWKASGLDVLTRADVGKRYVVRGKVKAHSEYKGEKQTIVSHAVANDFDAAAYAVGLAEDRRKELDGKRKAGTLSAEETAELDAIKAAEKAARKAKSAEVSKFATIETELHTSHMPMTHEALKVTGTDIKIDYYESSRWDYKSFPSKLVNYACITVDDGKYSKSFEGKNALANARKYVAELLCEAATTPA